MLGVFLAVGIVVDVVLGETYDTLPTLPYGPVVTIGVLAVAEFVIAWTTRNRLQGKRLAKPIAALAVARLAALAKASSLLGSAFAGAWVGALVYLLRLRGGGDAIDHDRQLTIAGIAASVLLTGAALWLEWVCRVRRPPEAKQDDARRAA